MIIVYDVINIKKMYNSRVLVSLVLHRGTSYHFKNI